MMEQTTTGRTTTKWWTPYMTPQTMLWVLAAFVYGVIFWKDSQDNWNKTRKVEKDMELKANKEEFNALKDQVNRQYQTAREEREKLLQAQKEDRDREFKAIEEVADYMHFEQGRQQGLKEHK